MKDFRQLKVWEKSHHLAIKVYKATRKFPKEELYGLTAQIRRACISIPANIAEGCGRNSEPDLGRFLTIAMGSASELEYLLLLSNDLELMSSLEHQDLSKDAVEVKRMLTSLILKLKADR